MIFNLRIQVNKNNKDETNNSTNKHILDNCTHLTENEKRCINDEGVDLIKGWKDSGLSANEITKVIGGMITHKKKLDKLEVKKKLEEEIKMRISKKKVIIMEEFTFIKNM